MVKISLNLDDVGEGFSVVEPGRYNAKVTEIAEQESQSGNPMLIWTWEIVGGEYDGKELRSYTSLQEHALFGLKEHLEAFGLSGEIELETDKLVGKVASIGVTKQEIRSNKTGDMIEVNRVQGIRPSAQKSSSVAQSKGSVVRKGKGNVPL